LTGEILWSANVFAWISLLGLALGLIYITLYRWLLPWLPVWLRTTPSNPTWKDLRVAGLLAGLSFAFGLMVVI
jgi:hypothetical protein